MRSALSIAARGEPKRLRQTEQILMSGRGAWGVVPIEVSRMLIEMTSLLVVMYCLDFLVVVVVVFVICHCRRCECDCH